MAIGGIAGGVSGGVGSAVSGSITGAVSGSAGAALGGVAGGVASGAAGGAASYLASAALTGRRSGSWEDFGRSVGIGAAIGGAFGAVDATAIGLTEWDAAIGAPSGAASSSGSFAEGPLVGAAQGAAAYGFLKWVVGAPKGLALAGAASGFGNGVIAGAAGTYNWESLTGYLAAALDSTVGLVGTTLGNAVSVGNMIAGAEYSAASSFRQNRLVFTNGAHIKGDHAFTLGGNVVSNAGAGGGELLNHHETLHLWQSRLFGPAWHATYVAWGIGGAIGGGGMALFSGENVPLGAEASGYVSNPFEHYAYVNQGTWDSYSSRYPVGIVW